MNQDGTKLWGDAVPFVKDGENIYVSGCGISQGVSPIARMSAPKQPAVNFAPDGRPANARFSSSAKFTAGCLGALCVL